VTPTRATLTKLMISVFWGGAVAIGVSIFSITAFLRHFPDTENFILSLPVIMQAGPLLALPLCMIFRNVHPKKVTVWLFFFVRLAMVPLPFLALFADDTVTAWGAFLCFAIMALLCTMSGGVVGAWFRQVIPCRVQGTFMGLRSAVCNVLLMVMAALSGWLIEAGTELLGSFRLTFAILFAVGTACGFGDVLYLHKAGEGRPAQVPVRSFRQELRDVIVPERLWNVSVVSMLAMAGTVFLLPVSVIILYDLGLTDTQVGILTAAGMGGLAGGLYVGGIFSDGKWLRHVFLAGVLMQAVGFAGCCLVSLYPAGQWMWSSWPVMFVLLPLQMIASVGTGSVISGTTKLIYRTSHHGTSMTFAFILSVDMLMRLVLAAVAGLCMPLFSEIAGDGQTLARDVPLLYGCAALVALTCGGMMLILLLRILVPRQECRVAVASSC